MGYSFSWGCIDNCDSSKGWSLSGSIPNEHVLPYNCGGFLDVYTNRQKKFFINVLTWHGEYMAFKTLLVQFCAHFIGKNVMHL
jgi:hypothetical protein